MIVRSLEQDSRASIVAVADASLSTRCGMRGTPIAAAIARSIATLGLSAAARQDGFGLIAVDQAFRPVVAVRPRVGEAHVRECLDAYRRSTRLPVAPRAAAPSMAAQLGRASLVAVISDFLFADTVRIIAELAVLSTTRDVFLLMVDARFAFACPDVSSGWIQTTDAETGRTCLLSRQEYLRLATRVGEWQDAVMRQAGEAHVDLVRVECDRWDMERALLELVDGSGDPDRDVVVRFVSSVGRPPGAEDGAAREELYWRFLCAGAVLVGAGTCLLRQPAELWWQAGVAAVAMLLIAAVTG